MARITTVQWRPCPWRAAAPVPVPRGGVGGGGNGNGEDLLAVIMVSGIPCWDERDGIFVDVWSGLVVEESAGRG